MPNQPDFYAVLQVHFAAEPEVIHVAYRRLALKYHPDVNPLPGAGQRMAQINEAYAVLSHPAQRAAYDREHAINRSGAHTTPRSAPLVQVAPTSIDVGDLELGQARMISLRVTNQGSGALEGMVLCNVSWLKAVPTEFSGNQADIALRFQPEAAGRLASAHAVEVITNGGRVPVSVHGVCVAPQVEPWVSKVSTRSDADRSWGSQQTLCDVFTVDSKCRGLLQRSQGRFSDALNAADQNTILLHDVETIALDKQSPPRSLVSKLVQRDRVVAVVPHGEDASPRLQQRLWVAKSAVAELITAPPLLIHGIVHLPPVIEVLNPSQRWLPPFLPVTQAEVRWGVGDSATVISTPLLLLNRRFIKAMLDAPPVAGGRSDAGKR